MYLMLLNCITNTSLFEEQGCWLKLANKTPGNRTIDNCLTRNSCDSCLRFVSQRNIIITIIKNHEACFDLNTADESIFIDFALSPFVNAVFPVSHMLQKSGHFTALEGDTNLRPDIKFHTSIDRKKFDCLLIEVKCPKSTSDDDLFKLSIEMQYALNRLIGYGGSNPVVYGVLVYGYACSIYKMTLVGPKVYVMMKMKA
ncbi:hypothetical protein BDB01DRAFT_890877 [Pilobolus umbonatus]|nr:hypothetical protein BDB01DRAFT_890877 [Pilobolus umbonatus]